MKKRVQLVLKIRGKTSQDSQNTFISGKALDGHNLSSHRGHSREIRRELADIRRLYKENS